MYFLLERQRRGDSGIGRDLHLSVDTSLRLRVCVRFMRVLRAHGSLRDVTDYNGHVGGTCRTFRRARRGCQW